MKSGSRPFPEAGDKLGVDVDGVLAQQPKRELACVRRAERVERKRGGEQAAAPRRPRL